MNTPSRIMLSSNQISIYNCEQLALLLKSKLNRPTYLLVASAAADSGRSEVRCNFEETQSTYVNTDTTSNFGYKINQFRCHCLTDTFCSQTNKTVLDIENLFLVLRFCNSHAHKSVITRSDCCDCHIKLSGTQLLDGATRYYDVIFCLQSEWVICSLERREDGGGRRLSIRFKGF